MADTLDIWKELRNSETFKKIVQDAEESAGGLTNNGGTFERSEHIEGYISAAIKYEAERKQQLSDCWDAAYAVGWSSGSNDSMDDDDKAKAAYLDKIINTTSSTNKE